MTYMSASNLLAAYRYPEVLATARPGFTPAQLLDGSASTLCQQELKSAPVSGTEKCASGRGRAAGI
jgi:hypothetical protein